MVRASCLLLGSLAASEPLLTWVIQGLTCLWCPCLQAECQKIGCKAVMLVAIQRGQCFVLTSTVSHCTMAALNAKSEAVKEWHAGQELMPVLKLSPS